LKLSYYISKRINTSNKSSFSATIHNVAVASISIGLAVMIASFLILFGFKSTIREKIVSFGAHFQLTKFTLSNSLESDPVSEVNDFYQNWQEYEFIKHIQRFAYKAGLLTTDEEVYGVFLKGIGPEFNRNQFESNLIQGDFIRFNDSSTSNDIIISKKIANDLKLDTGSRVTIMFPQNPPRFRRLNIRGIYDTGMEEFDEQLIIGDLKLIQRLNDWDSLQVGGFELFINDYSQIDRAEEKLFDILGYDLYIQKVTDNYAEIFDWLELINQNVYIFLVIILFVACVNMISVLLILIMERTSMIGILKAMGSTNKQIRDIFVVNGMLLITKGLLWGNIIAIGFGALQYYYKIFPLDPENYYMSYVPIEWDLLTIILLNVLTFVVVSVVLLVPTLIISRINPIKSIRFD